MKWYKDSHSVKGKMMFLEQMKKFVEWLQSAEEGNYWLSKQYPLTYGKIFINVLDFGSKEMLGTKSLHTGDVNSQLSGLLAS